MPQCETHVRPLLALPREGLVECWKGIVAETPPVRDSAKARRTHALAALRRLELAAQNLACSDQVKPLLGRIERMIGES